MAKGSSDEVDSIVIGSGSMQGYHTLGEIWDIYDRLAQLYPNYVSEQLDYGRTKENNPLRGFILTDDARNATNL